MKSTKFLATALAASLALMMAGCAGGAAADTGTGDGSSSAATDDGSGGKVQGITDTEVLIANSAATSGAYAPVGVPFIAGIQGYLDMVNKDGGVDGRTITFLHTDDEFDPAKGAAALTKFIEDDKVFAIVGHFGTPVVAATVDTLKESGIPSVYFATGIGQLYAEDATTDAEGANLFPVQPLYRTEGGIMAAYAAGKFGATKIGIIYTNDDAGSDLEKGAVSQITSMDGVDYVEEQVAAGAADVSAAVTSIKNADVDFVIIAAIQGTMPTIVKELAAQGVGKDAITSYVNVSSAMSDAVSADIQGKFDLYGPGWVDYSTDTAQASLADFQANVDSQYANNVYAQTGWIAASFFVEGLKRLEGKEVTWDSYKAAMEEAPIQNPFGGTIDYSNGQRKGTQQMSLSKVVPVSDANPVGWEPVEPLQSIDALLGK
ncbi:ABC transporter substrate-binding protein [Isoptericola sp. b441]|uniref:ABC transporter substrate-binding protein n=1 Tax=Actinotalea lenta TaxID=3064654 RepID=A0ABT9DE10_9CELL|nr:MULTISPECIES: ABC transporter substrate-binding protein [unclassified Isoptericola]MDO8107593.1 ABC transporter substrate-binding protein [Isoptericola sp. b441]MDO8120747.1 ABC transporter substrate-binding protein [Isoptericola sp. b490]